MVKTVGNWQTTPTETIAAAAYLVSLSEDGQRLAALTDDGASFEVWNTQTNSLLLTATADEPNSGFSIVAISKDGTQVAAIKFTSTTGEQRLIVQAIEDGRVLLNKPLNPPQLPPPKKDYITQPYATDIVFSPDGKQVITQFALSTKLSSEPFGSTIYNSISFHDIKTGEVAQSIDLLGVDDKVPVGYMVSPDGSLLASLSSDFSNLTISDLGIITRVTIWQRNQDNRFDYLTTLPISEDGFAVFDAAFTTSNQLNLITTSSLSNLLANPMAGKPSQISLETWNPQTATRVSSTILPTENCIGPDNVLLSPDGTGYYSSYPDAGTCLGNVKTGEFQKLPDQPFTFNSMVKFSGNGNRLAISNSADSIGQNVQIFSKSQN
ncbi:hypothetical protein [Leptolyngbya sp. BC1307]|uniref:WD40 repeat domain-containing protein n=1 Tax=Leptolyngbya sp. BC1307 TaxID=2029589 RepID=UPI001140CB58|nr:hypothetical protein [Leptolyngbya sp. BC1307]